MNYFNQLLKVCAALGRHVRVSGCEDAADREEFLIEHLGVPVAWIAEAKATRAKREGNHKVGTSPVVFSFLARSSLRSRAPRMRF